jgi:hypothetical protein
MSLNSASGGASMRGRTAILATLSVRAIVRADVVEFAVTRARQRELPPPFDEGPVDRSCTVAVGKTARYDVDLTRR